MENTMQYTLGTNDHGVASRVVVIPEGASYGRTGALTAKKDLLRVEVQADDNWWSVGVWYADTIRKHERDTGWMIEGSMRNWDLTADQVNTLLDKLEA